MREEYDVKFEFGDFLAEQYCVSNMDCVKSENSAGREVPYYTAEERAIAKSAYEAGFSKALSVKEGALPKALHLLKRVVQWESFQGSGCPKFADITTDIKVFLQGVEA